MVRAADRAAAIGLSALQVFSDNPTSWRRRPTLPRELPAFRDRLAAHGIAPLAVHAPYLVNLAGPEPDIHERSISVLANELRVAADYGARFVNVHVGSHRGSGVEAGIDRLADGVRLTFASLALDPPAPANPAAVDPAAVDPAAATPAKPDPEETILVLENSAGAGFGLGASIHELAQIDAAITAAGVNPSRFGYCLDTAHAWGAGYAIDTQDGVDSMLAEFDLRIGLHRLRMVHLNDSRSELGSRTDRHEHIGAGRIGAAGLRRLLTNPALDHVTYYLETPGMDDGWDAVNVARVLALADGRDLEPLPPEAFHVRSAKGRSAPAESGDDRATHAR